MVRVRIGDEEQELSWEDWENRVRGGRIPPDALVCIEAVTVDRFVRAQHLELYRSLRNDAAIAWQGQFTWGPPPVLTALLVGLQIRIWWFARLPEVADVLVVDFTNWTAPALEDGQTWRMITMGLLHTDLFHLVLNMLWLAYTGWNLERALGRLNLATLYFASVIGGSLLSMYGSPETPSLGASGGVFGLVAASVAFGLARPELLPERARRVFGVAMAPYLVVMFASGLMNDGTDNWSHLGGLLTGGLLALFLDPEPIQRRPRWNARLRAAVAAACTALVVGLGVVGPRAYPTIDAEVARMSRLPAALRDGSDDDWSARSLTWSVPVGWRTGMTAVGAAGFVSPSPEGERAWAVEEDKTAAPLDPEEIRVRWTDDLVRGWPSAVVGPLEPDVVAGHDGFRAVVSLDGDSNEILEWRFAVRGVWVLHEIWQVDAERARRLAPLRDRLRDRVAWADPPALVEARHDVERMPRSIRARAALANALSEIGDAEQAMSIWDELVRERPDDPTIWEGVLRTVRWYPERVEDPDALWSAALSRHPTPAIVVEVAMGLEAAGRPDVARGLLEAAWILAPGDKVLRRARSSRQLSRSLDPLTNLPWSVVADPLTGARFDDDEIGRRSEVTLDLPTAARLGASLADTEDRLLQALRDGLSGSTDPVGPLVQIKHGHRPDDLARTLEGLREDLRTLDRGGRVAWFPSDLPPGAVADLAARIDSRLGALARPGDLDSPPDAPE